MFRKYEKTFRILVPGINVPGKLILSKDEASALLGAPVIIEEKMDGANVGIIRTKNDFKLQKRGSLVDVSEHDQFSFFTAWAHNIAYEKIMALPRGLILYGELMYAKHTVFYDKLPDYFLAFDAFDTKKERWISFDERHQLCWDLGFAEVPLVAQNHFRKEELAGLIPAVSAYGNEPAEGIVIKRYRKDGTKLQAKLVRLEFIKRLEENEHWMHQTVIQNKLGNKETWRHGNG